MMKSLIVNTADQGGGAAIAAMNLHAALQTAGINSQVIVGSRQVDDASIHQMPRGIRPLDRIATKGLRRYGLNEMGTTSSFLLLREPSFREANVVNLHNLHGGYFNLASLPMLAARKPIVLTLHDMWMFTGHCVYDYDCGRWKMGCGQCPHPDVYPAIRRDATQLEWRIKKWAFGRKHIQIIAISRWMKSQIQESLLSELTVTHIPNGLDTGVYSPHCQSECRQRLQLSDGKFIVLFAAASLVDPRKGPDVLCEALWHLPEETRQRVCVVAMGAGRLKDFPVEVHHMGFVTDAATKVNAYCAADVLAVPSRIDNLPVVIQEGMSCGLPALACRVGGIPDLVDDGSTGMTVRGENPVEFADCLARYIAQPELLASMRQQCRLYAVENWSLPVQGRAYRRVFEDAWQQWQANHSLAK